MVPLDATAAGAAALPVDQSTRPLASSVNCSRSTAPLAQVRVGGAVRGRLVFQALLLRLDARLHLDRRRLVADIAVDHAPIDRLLLARRIALKHLKIERIAVELRHSVQHNAFEARAPILLNRQLVAHERLGKVMNVANLTRNGDALHIVRAHRRIVRHRVLGRVPLAAVHEPVADHHACSALAGFAVNHCDILVVLRHPLLHRVAELVDQFKRRRVVVIKRKALHKRNKKASQSNVTTPSMIATFDSHLDTIVEFARLVKALGTEIVDWRNRSTKHSLRKQHCLPLYLSL